MLEYHYDKQKTAIYQFKWTSEPKDLIRNKTLKRKK